MTELLNLNERDDIKLYKNKISNICKNISEVIHKISSQFELKQREKELGNYAKELINIYDDLGIWKLYELSEKFIRILQEASNSDLNYRFHNGLFILSEIIIVNTITIDKFLANRDTDIKTDAMALNAVNSVIQDYFRG